MLSAKVVQPNTPTPCGLVAATTQTHLSYQSLNFSVSDTVLPRVIIFSSELMLYVFCISDHETIFTQWPRTRDVTRSQAL